MLYRVGMLASAKRVIALRKGAPESGHYRGEKVVSLRSYPVTIGLEACPLGTIPHEIPAAAGRTGARGCRAFVPDLLAGAPAINNADPCDCSVATRTTAVCGMCHTTNSEDKARN
jgi:hypothetical protein